MMENCPGLVARNTPRAMPAALRLAELAADQARISYVGHSTFLLESPRNVKIATDYNDYVKPRVLPDIANWRTTHPTHYTDLRARQINTLRGRGRPTPARTICRVGKSVDVRIRNADQYPQLERRAWLAN